MGWPLAAQVPTELVLLALQQASPLSQPAPGLSVDAYCGSRHTSAACHARSDLAGFVPSFTRPDNPYDNAQSEADWSTLRI